MSVCVQVRVSIKGTGSVLFTGGAADVQPPHSLSLPLLYSYSQQSWEYSRECSNLRWLGMVPARLLAES